MYNKQSGLEVAITLGSILGVKLCVHCGGKSEFAKGYCLNLMKWESWETLSYTNPYIAFICSACILLDLNKTVRLGKKAHLRVLWLHSQLNHRHINIVMHHRQFRLQLFCNSASVHDICFRCCSWVSRLAHKRQFFLNDTDPQFTSLSFHRFLLLIGQSAESWTDGEDAVDFQGVIHFEAFPVLVHLQTPHLRQLSKTSCSSCRNQLRGRWWKICNAP